MYNRFRKVALQPNEVGFEPPKVSDAGGARRQGRRRPGAAVGQRASVEVSRIGKNARPEKNPPVEVTPLPVCSKVGFSPTLAVRSWACAAQPAVTRPATANPIA